MSEDIKDARGVSVKYARQDLNLRPSAPEADALSTELRARAVVKTGEGSLPP
jgi:hypothetical protein